MQCRGRAGPGRARPGRAGGRAAGRAGSKTAGVGRYHEGADCAENFFGDCGAAMRGLFRDGPGSSQVRAEQGSGAESRILLGVLP